MTSALLRSAALTLALTGAVGVGGCHRGFAGGDGSRDRPLQVTSRLDCPDRSGDLQRTAEATDGRSCHYAGPDGQEVTLAYLALDGRPPEDALKATEADLRTLVPAAAAPEPGSLRPASEDTTKVDVSTGDKDDDEDKDDDKRDDRRDGASRSDAAPGTPVPPRPPEPPQIDKAWSTSRHGGHGEHVRVNLPFLHIEADDSGARVRAFGASVDASDDGAVVRGPFGTHIDAHHGGAEMRFGEVGRERADLTYIIAGDQAGPSGYRAAAYVAKGPVAGPLVIATSRARTDGENHHDAVRDLKHLVNLNVRAR